MNLPEKRKKIENVQKFTLKKVKFEESIKEDVCIVKMKNSRKDIKIPMSCLTLKSKEMIESFNQGKQDVSEQRPIVKRARVQSAKVLKTDDSQVKSINTTEISKGHKSYLLRRMSEIYNKGSYLLHKPVKIIACHGKTTPNYSVIFSSRSGHVNISSVPHSILLEKFPELFIDFISKAKISLENP